MVHYPNNLEPHVTLNPRQREVLNRCLGGATNAEVGASLRISSNTVGRHTATILEVTGAPDSTTLRMWGVLHEDCCLRAEPDA